MDNGLIFNVKLTTLFACVALTTNIAVFGIISCYEAGTLKLLDFAILDANVLETPVISDRTSHYMGRIMADLRNVAITYDEDCLSATGKYETACKLYVTSFSPLEGKITDIVTHYIDLDNLRSHQAVLSVTYALALIGLCACAVFGILYLTKFGAYKILWVFANWANAVNSGFSISFVTVLSSYRELTKNHIWSTVPKSYPYILMKYDDLDNLCWACTGLACLAALNSALTGLVQCVSLGDLLHPPPIQPTKQYLLSHINSLSSNTSSIHSEESSREIEMIPQFNRPQLCDALAPTPISSSLEPMLNLDRRTKSDSAIHYSQQE